MAQRKTVENISVPLALPTGLANRVEIAHNLLEGELEQLRTAGERSLLLRFSKA